MNNNNWICFDGNLIEGNSPVAPATSRGLMYGDGVFDTLRVYSGRIFLFEEHFRRLKAGIQTLDINIPHKITIHRLRDDIKLLLDKKELLNTDSIVRIQFWRAGNRGYLPVGEAEVHYAIIASECPATFKNPHLKTIDRCRIPTKALPSNYKFTNGINYILAAREASQKGGDDALMQTVDGQISETTIANIFWQKGDMIFTPSEQCDLLPGITRNILIDLIKNSENWTLEIGEFPLKNIYDADAVWICNSVREILPVAAIDAQYFSLNSAIFDELNRQFYAYRNKHLEAF